MSKRRDYKNKAWYAYDGIGDPYHAASYRKITQKLKCENGKHICAIFAGHGDINPFSPLSANIQQYIANGLVSGLAQPPHYKKHSQYYVYLKY
ncbi:hypothetical protein HDF26_000845 [Pedobacter cryoconitis]|uniref:Uncharacterized protein n=1 Tax=Pedobacter cryoconitis TaxID=188932 RepID=A0A7W8ZPK2_9SPHI|nr:hypothetical protein [Pedobacter cryoconitis]MBB5637826.1 hypothetical protein [Pedobacter cryoconitis]MBB6270418.1 hypothetical protein [Pedobacter cryoconitis]